MPEFPLQDLPPALPVGKPLDALERPELEALEQGLARRYAAHRAAGLDLDLTRGKPSAEQLDLSNALDGILGGDFRSADGTDVRNYGGLTGLPEMRALAAGVMDGALGPDEVIAAGSSSLSLMYEVLVEAAFFGVGGAGDEPPGSPARAPWAGEPEPPRFLCPVPGYDRHFTLCEALGIDMVPVPMTPAGPDMDVVEALVGEDPRIRGMWCVPKYSNPGGEVYSPEVVERIAGLGRIAHPTFRVMWDNAYSVHDLADDPPELASVVTAARRQGTEDQVMLFGSFSKVTFAGGAVAFLGGSPRNVRRLERHLSASRIGPDKVNQLRHVRLLGDRDGIRAHMRRHAELVRPKFERVQARLEGALEGSGMGRWTRPLGGYFVSFWTRPGLASRVVALAAEAGVRLTPAGSAFPYGRDPDDTHIRLAPTFPGLEELDRAMEVFVDCVALAAVRQRLGRTN